jgi:hypothetical protein
MCFPVGMRLPSEPEGVCFPVGEGTEPFVAKLCFPVGFGPKESSQGIFNSSVCKSTGAEVLPGIALRASR